MSANVPAKPMTDDVVDKIAAEIGLQVAHHIETMHPAATENIAWNSAKKSIQGIVRNAVKAAGEAAEQGRAEDWIKDCRKRRRQENAAAREAAASTPDQIEGA